MQAPKADHRMGTRMDERVYIGTSGWNYDAWRDPFYQGTARKHWLGFCAERFSAIEVNATFYRLQRRETFERWRDETPADFRFAVKANRYLTHNKKLSDPLPAIRTEREHAEGLGDKLAAVVWQLPGNFHSNLERLERFADALHAWDQPRHTIEFRHTSWFADAVAECLQRHGIAVCQSDAADWPLWESVTTDMVYVRLHGHTQTYASDYSDEELRGWAGKINRWREEERDVHLYFDNDAMCHAPFNALRLIELTGGSRA